MKRFFDILCAASALALLAPLLLAIALIVRIDSPGPVLYRQTRVGLGGKTFSMYKFRSMVTNADRIGGYQTQQQDPRITTSGRWLRRTSLDELPQLLNVLKGDMSVVGPRPDVPQQQSLYLRNDWTLRHSVRPGITGLAQATLRSDATTEQRLQLDLDYVGRHSLLFDLRIILMTVRQLWTKGSY